MTFGHPLKEITGTEINPQFWKQVNLANWQMEENNKATKIREKCFEYSANKEKLADLLDHLDVTIDRIGKSSEFEEYEEFSVHGESWVYLVRITKRPDNSIDDQINNKTKNKVKISFMFCDSIDHKEKNKKPDLYSILANVGAEYGTDQMTYTEFREEFGYDDTSKTKQLFKRCVAHSKKLRKIFSQEEIEVLPS